MMFVQAGTICHGCGEEITEGRPIVVDCEEHGQHTYCGAKCMREAVRVHG
jgi:hypothetical protein